MRNDINEIKNDEQKLPYNVDPKLLFKMMEELKTVNEDGIDQDTFYKNIDILANSNRGYSVGMLKFLGLIKTDAKKIYLTTNGMSYRYTSGEKGKEFLAKILPDRYRTLLKWIKYSGGDMLINDLKIKYIQNFGKMKSDVIFDRSVTVFLKYCQALGLLSYYKKGRMSKCALTPKGIELIIQAPGRTPLETPLEKTVDPPHNHNINMKIDNLPTDYKYPIKILVPDRAPFVWDIQTEEDLAVIDSVISSIKQSWKNFKKINTTQES
jgi:hypothetical protein